MIMGPEVKYGGRISSGFFSDVYRGEWLRGDKEIVIKELNLDADSNADMMVFLDVVDDWRRLRCPYILPLLGASSTTRSPPWFLISPYSE